jgi:hypothetical protein
VGLNLIFLTVSSAMSLLRLSRREALDRQLPA